MSLHRRPIPAHPPENLINNGSASHSRKSSQIVTAREVEREARRPGAPQAIDQARVSAARVSRSSGPDDRRVGVAAQPWRNDAGLGEVLEERDSGRRVIGQAVEEEERAR